MVYYDRFYSTGYSNPINHHHTGSNFGSNPGSSQNRISDQSIIHNPTYRRYADGYTHPANPANQNSHAH
jgi:hypothetical protein